MSAKRTQRRDLRKEKDTTLHEKERGRESRREKRVEKNRQLE
jgi:hypothetical protein